MNLDLVSSILPGVTGNTSYDTDGILVEFRLIAVAVVASYQAFDNATLPWSDQTTSGPIGATVAIIDTWIAAISTNPSIIANGMAPTKIKDQNSSTNSGGTNGFVYSFPSSVVGVPAGATQPHLGLYGTETSINVKACNEYTDDATSSGYGSFANAPGHLSSTSFTGDSGYDKQILIAYDTTDGEEFIAVGIRAGAAATDSGGIFAGVDTSGNWVMTVNELGLAYDTIRSDWTGSAGPEDTDPELAVVTSGWEQFCLRANAPWGITSGVLTQADWRAANSNVFSGRDTSASFGGYITINEGGLSGQLIAFGYETIGILCPTS